MPFSPRSPGGAVPGKVYLFNCPFEEKENAKKMGAKWDVKAGSWFVPEGEALEPFNKWHPNERKYIVCSYSEKDAAKTAGARWDASCKQWYFDANDSDAESKLEKWLPSSKRKDTSKTKKKQANNTKRRASTIPQKVKPTALTKIHLATIPRVNNDMTIAQLHAECRARDPSVKGLSNKNKTWLLDRLNVGTPWISAEPSNQMATIKTEDPPQVKKSTAPTKKSSIVSKVQEKKATVNASANKTIHVDMTISQLQMECRARDPDIKGLTNKNKSWFLDHLRIGSARAPTIHEGLTITQLQEECRIRDPDIRGLTNKNKSWFLDQLKVGTTWVSWSQWIHADMTVAQLQMECRARDPVIKGLTNKNKSWFLDHLKIGSAWVSSSQWKQAQAKKTNVPTVHAVAASKPKVEAATKKKATSSKGKEDEIAAKSKSTPLVRQTKLNFGSQSTPVLSQTTLNFSQSTPSLSQTTLNFGSQSTPSLSQTILEESPENPNVKPTSSRSLSKGLKESKKRPIKVDPNVKKSSDAKSGPSKKKLKAASTTNTSKSEKRTVAIAATQTDAINASDHSSSFDTIVQYKRVTNKMSLEELREEAKARRLLTITKVKCRLLEELVEGSICVYVSPEYKAYQNLLKRMETEEPALRDAQDEKLAVVEERREKQREKQREKRRLDKERKLAEAKRQLAEEKREKKEKRKTEIVRQLSLHTHSFPQVHTCCLAKSDGLTTHGLSRNGTCDVCEKKRGGYNYYEYQYCRHPVTLYSCESCDWDICAECFKEENMGQAEKVALAKNRQKEREEEQRKERERHRKEEEEREKRFDAETRFSAKIRKVTGKHLNPKASGMKYTVWCSENYMYSHEEPTKEFDSVWATAEEANDRAEFLFFWKNPWGWDAEQVDNEGPEQVDTGGLKGWICDPDGSKYDWKVGIVPSSAFPYLDNVSKQRHTHDESEVKQNEAYSYDGFSIF